MNGVAAILKIAAISLEELPEGPLPDLPGATVATALKMDSPDPPAFNKEVDLAFPKPADAPDNAVFFVYRRLDGPDGRVVYESIDYADVEGEGANAKVVTTSYPFSGYVSSINGFNASGLDAGGAIGNQLTNYAILMYASDQASPGRALGGVVTGKVLRLKWAPGATTPSYEPVKGALVSGVDASGQPLFAQSANAGQPPTVAVSQADGTYSLFDRQYTGGAVTLSATIDNLTRTATAYEVDPQNAKSPGLRFAKNVATANVTFPAVAPLAPASPVQVSVLTLDANGVRKASNGIVIAGEQIVIGINAGGNTVQRVTVQSGSQSTEYGVRVDPLAPQAGSFAVIAENSLPFATPGSYAITATALNPEGGVITGSLVVRAVVPGGGNNDALPNDAPAVITARTVPKANATGVQIGALPQIAFTEPVQNVPGHVTLTEAGGASIGIMLSGVGPNGPIASLTPQSIVTSLTIQPMAGLKYGTAYTLALSSDIVDTDVAPNPNKPLTPYTTTFTTFAPESIGQTDELFTAGGMAVIGDRAYIATPQNNGRFFTNLRLFDVSDPTSPLEIASSEPSTSSIFKAPPAFWLGLPVDVVADEASPLTGGAVVAVATTPLTYPYHTSNVRLYDVSNEQQWRWIGAVSLGRDPSDGMIRRVEMEGEMLYAVTAGIGKGIQFVNLNEVRSAFDASLADGEQSAGYWQMQGQLNSTEGFAQEAIVQTVPVDTGTGANSQLWDLAVTDLAINGITQPAVVATGRSPLVIASQTDGLIYNGEITDSLGGPALTGWGYGVAAGTVAGTPIAVVSAVGVDGAPVSGPHVLAIVDLSNPSAPRSLALLSLPGSAATVQDVVLRETSVFIGTNTGTYVVNIADSNSPRFVGTIPGVQGRLGFSSDSILIGTRRGLTEIINPEGGVKTAALSGPLLIIPRIPAQLTREVPATPRPGGNEAEQSAVIEELLSDARVQVLMIGGVPLRGALTLLQSGAGLLTQALNFVGTRAAALIPRGTRFNAGAVLSVKADAESDDGSILLEQAAFPAGSVQLIVDANNDRDLTLADVTDAKADKKWAFWQTDMDQLDTHFGLADLATIRILSRVPVKGLRLVMRSATSDEVWALTEKRSTGALRSYLEDKKSAEAQLSYTSMGRYCPGSLSNLMGDCRATAAQPLYLPPMKVGENDYLFRCEKCSTTDDRKLVVEFEIADGIYEAVSFAQVDIRPLSDWMTVYSARRPSGHLPAKNIVEASGWKSIPADVSDLTFLVHGYNVDSNQAATSTFPTLFKRMYWAGVPILQPQPHSQYVVGIIWPGDEGTLPPINFPRDEFRAFQTGVPLSEFLAHQRQIHSGAIRVVAHSLGSLAVNNAIALQSSRIVDDFVMVDAAVAAEAFSCTFTPSATEVGALVTGDGAMSKGFPDDAKWSIEWDRLYASRGNYRSAALCNQGDGDCRSEFDMYALVRLC